MQLKIEGRHVEVTTSMHDYVQTKMAKLERHFDHLVNVHVVLAVEKQRQKAEATIHVAGNDIHAESEDDAMYAAIDSMIDKLDRQIKKHKEKITNHRA